MDPRDSASSRDFLYVAIVIVTLVAASAVGAMRIGPIVIVCGSGFGGCTSVAPGHSPVFSSYAEPTAVRPFNPISDATVYAAGLFDCR